MLLVSLKILLNQFAVVVVYTMHWFGRVSFNLFEFVHDTGALTLAGFKLWLLAILWSETIFVKVEALQTLQWSESVSNKQELADYIIHYFQLTGIQKKEKLLGMSCLVRWKTDFSGLFLYKKLTR